MKEFHVLGIVVESQSGLNLTAANTEPISKLVVGEGPIELYLPISEVADVARVS